MLKKTGKNYNMSLKEKLQISYKNIFYVGITILIVSLTVLLVTNMQYRKAINSYGNSQAQVGKLGMELNKQQILLRDIAILQEGDEKSSEVDTFNDSIKNSDAQLDLVGQTIIGTEEKQIYAKLTENIKKYTSLREDIMNYSIQGNKEEAMYLLNGEVQEISNAICENIEQLLQAKIDASKNIIHKLRILEAGAVIILVVCFVIFKRMTSSFSKKNAEIIVEPLEMLKTASDKLANGNLEIDLQVNSFDEIGQLMNNFNFMSESLKKYIDELTRIFGNMAGGNLDVATTDIYKGDFLMLKECADNILWVLNDTLKNIEDAAMEISGGSKQVSEAAQSLSEGTSDQASAIEQLSASIDEINNEVRNNSENAQNTDKIVRNLEKHIKQSNNKMNSMVEAMDEIQDSSQNIKNIIDTIAEIAEQTNLLALNAAIEATKVGEAGKGFAVVADEIRILAEQSSEAVQDTAILVESSIQSVDKGRDIVDMVSNDLCNVLKESMNASKLVGEITSASNEQALAINEVTQGLDQIADVVQSNSAISEECAAASQELLVQVETLNNMMSRYNLKL